jgi:hypothetical protein
VHFYFQPYYSFTLLLYHAYHYIPALAEYQPKMYLTLLFSHVIQTYFLEAEEDLKFFNMEL